MNIIYCLESVVGSTIAGYNWYFSSEHSYNKIIKFKSRWRWLYMNIKASIEKYSYLRTTLDSLNVYLIKCNLLMRFDCGSFIWTCFIIEWYVWAAIHMRDRCFRWSDKNGWSWAFRELTCNLREIWENYLDCKNLTVLFSPQIILVEENSAHYQIPIMTLSFLFSEKSMQCTLTCINTLSSRPNYEISVPVFIFSGFIFLAAY